MRKKQISGNWSQGHELTEFHFMAPSIEQTFSQPEGCHCVKWARSTLMRSGEKKISCLYIERFIYGAG